jgi:Flp pilus assembly protein CpaB
MRKNKQLILAVLIAGALVGLAWSSGLSRVEEKTVRLVAAARDIPAGSALSEDQLILVECPAELALAGYAQSVSEAAGLWTGQGFAAGELISPRSLAAKASGLVYPDAGAGRRLVTISLAAAAANGFWLEAGNRVDIYLVPRSRENSLGIQVMENIRIMAARIPRSSRRPARCCAWTWTAPRLRRYSALTACTTCSWPSSTKVLVAD